MSKTIYFTRHGEAEHNARGIFAGSSLDTHLTDIGKKTAEKIALKILADGGAKIIICSNLKRSKETAKIFANILSAEIIVDSALDEINVGDFSSLGVEQVKQRFPTESKPFYSNELKSWNFPNGESYDQIKDRVKKIDKLIKELPNEKVVICSHAMLNRVVFFELFKKISDAWKDDHYKQDKVYRYKLGNKKIFEELNSPSILLIGWNYPPKLGGVESVMAEHASILKENGFNVSVLTSAISKNEEALVGGVKVYRNKIIDPSRKINEKAALAVLGRIINNDKPQIAQFHNGCYPAGSTSITNGAKNIELIFGLLKKAQLLILDWEHNAQLKAPELMKDLRSLNWDGIIFVSEYVKKQWKKLGFNAKKSIVFKNWVDVSKFQNSKISSEFKNIQNGEKIIFFPSRILKVSTKEYSAQKNFLLLAEACSALSKKKIGYRLVILADKQTRGEPQFKKIIDLLKKTGVYKNLTILDSVEKDEMPGLYRGADITCIPSLDEAFSLSYLEAMAAGSVPIGTNTGGTPEQIIDQETGYLLENTDAHELAMILAKLLTDDVLLKKVKSRAQKHAKKFDIKSSYKGLLKIYIDFLTRAK